jgi:hypothetical protein
MGYDVDVIKVKHTNKGEKDMDANRRALDRYHGKWGERYAFVATTRTLYAKASRTPAFGVHLQNEVLRRMGASVPAHKSRKHYGKAARAWIDWMLADTFHAEACL